MRIREVCVKLIRSQVPIGEGQRFRNSRQVFEAFRDMFLEPVEVFRVLLLDSKNRSGGFSRRACGGGAPAR